MNRLSDLHAMHQILSVFAMVLGHVPTTPKNFDYGVFAMKTCQCFPVTLYHLRVQYKGFVPLSHRRYIDDVLGATSCRREELEAFNNYFS